MRKLIALVCFVVVLPALAGPLISVDTTDPSSVGALSVDSSDVLAVAWYLPSTYDSVHIGIAFQELFSGGTYSAYLMNGIGTQASSFNEIANTTFTVDPASSQAPLFEGLNGLGSGWFYLVIGTTDLNSFGGWSTTTNPTVTLAPGVLQGDLSGFQFWASGADVNSAYLPSSNFLVDDLSFGQLMYNVSTPEPATLLLVLVGGLPLALLRRRALRRRG